MRKIAIVPVMASLAETLEAIEREIIVTTLRECNNNQSEVSRRLKVPPMTLRRRLKQYGFSKKSHYET